MSEPIPRAAHREMDRREALANEFFDVTEAELRPFVSDEASWYDFDYLDLAELQAIVESHYGVTLDESKLALPFWELLDHLAANRRVPDE